MPQDKPDTRLALLRAAERLFARDGVDGVSMRRIAVEAGQRNHSAAAYHFADKRELLDCLLDRHSGPIQATWTVALAHLAAEGRDNLRELVGLFVRPLVAKLDDPDGGPEYLLIAAELITSRSYPLSDMKAASGPGAMALSAALIRHIGEIPFPLMPLRMMRVAAVLYCSIADFHRLTSNGLGIDRTEFTEDLIGSLIGVLEAGREPRSGGGQD